VEDSPDKTTISAETRGHDTGDRAGEPDRRAVGAAGAVPGSWQSARHPRPFQDRLGEAEDGEGPGHVAAGPSGGLGDVGAARRDEAGRHRVERDYRLVASPRLRCGIYLQGGAGPHARPDLVPAVEHCDPGRRDRRLDRPPTSRTRGAQSERLSGVPSAVASTGRPRCFSRAVGRPGGYEGLVRVSSQRVRRLPSRVMMSGSRRALASSDMPWYPARRVIARSAGSGWPS
jgi:hypothetical protein